MIDIIEKIKNDNEKNPSSLMIATPMYGGACHARFFLSVIGMVEMLKDLGFRYRVNVLSNNSLVPHARNTLATAFVHSDFDRLLFLDADIEFKPHEVLRLWLADKDVVAGVYPKKSINWELVGRASRMGKEPLSDFTGMFTFNPLPNDITGQSDENGLVEVAEAGTGFMMIKRQVFEVLKEKVPSYLDSPDHVSRPTEHWDFFPIGVSGDRYQSEDFSFCHLWRAAGGKIFINPFISLGHVGEFVYNGSLARLGTEQIA